MEPSPKEKTYGKQNYQRYADVNSHGQKRIFQVSLGLIAGKSEKARSCKDTDTASHRSVELHVGCDQKSEAGASNDTFVAEDIKSLDQTYVSADQVQSSVVKDSKRSGSNKSSMLMKNDTTKTFPRVSSRGRGRGLPKPRNHDIKHSSELVSEKNRYYDADPHRRMSVLKDLPEEEEHFKKRISGDEALLNENQSMSESLEDQTDNQSEISSGLKASKSELPDLITCQAHGEKKGETSTEDSRNTRTAHSVDSHMDSLDAGCGPNSREPHAFRSRLLSSDLSGSHVKDHDLSNIKPDLSANKSYPASRDRFSVRKERDDADCPASKDMFSDRYAGYPASRDRRSDRKERDYAGCPAKQALRHKDKTIEQQHHDHKSSSQMTGRSKGSSSARLERQGHSSTAKKDKRSSQGYERKRTPPSQKKSQTVNIITSKPKRKTPSPNSKWNSSPCQSKEDTALPAAATREDSTENWDEEISEEGHCSMPIETDMAALTITENDKFKANIPSVLKSISESEENTQNGVKSPKHLCKGYQPEEEMQNLGTLPENESYSDDLQDDKAEIETNSAFFSSVSERVNALYLTFFKSEDTLKSVSVAKASKPNYEVGRDVNLDLRGGKLDDQDLEREASLNKLMQEPHHGNPRIGVGYTKSENNEIHSDQMYVDSDRNCDCLGESKEENTRSVKNASNGNTAKKGSFESVNRELDGTNLRNAERQGNLSDKVLRDCKGLEFESQGKEINIVQKNTREETNFVNTGNETRRELQSNKINGGQGNISEAKCYRSKSTDQRSMNKENRSNQKCTVKRDEDGKKSQDPSSKNASKKMTFKSINNDSRMNAGEEKDDKGLKINYGAHVTCDIQRVLSNGQAPKVEDLHSSQDETESFTYEENLCNIDLEDFLLSDEGKIHEEKPQELIGKESSSLEIHLAKDNSNIYPQSPVNLTPTRPLKESMNSSDMCSKSSPELRNHTSELDSEKDLGMDSQSDSDLFPQKQTSTSTPHNYNQHDPKWSYTSFHGYQQPYYWYGLPFFDAPSGNECLNPPRHLMPHFSPFKCVDKIYLPVKELSTENKKVREFLNSCSEELKRVIPEEHGDLTPFKTRISVDLVYDPYACGHPSEQTAPYLPPGFTPFFRAPPPNQAHHATRPTWPSHHMGTSTRAEAGARWPPGDQLTRPVQTPPVAATGSPSPSQLLLAQGFNPGMYPYHSQQGYAYPQDPAQPDNRQDCWTPADMDRQMAAIGDGVQRRSRPTQKLSHQGAAGPTTGKSSSSADSTPSTTPNSKSKKRGQRGRNHSAESTLTGISSFLTHDRLENSGWNQALKTEGVDGDNLHHQPPAKRMLHGCGDFSPSLTPECLDYNAWKKSMKVEEVNQDVHLRLHHQPPAKRMLHGRGDFSPSLTPECLDYKEWKKSMKVEEVNQDVYLRQKPPAEHNQRSNSSTISPFLTPECLSYNAWKKSMKVEEVIQDVHLRQKSPAEHNQRSNSSTISPFLTPECLSYNAWKKSMKVEEVNQDVHLRQKSPAEHNQRSHSSTVSNSVVHRRRSSSGQSHLGDQSMANIVTTEPTNASKSSNASPSFMENFSTVTNPAVQGFKSDTVQGHFSNQSMANTVTTESKNVSKSSNASPSFMGNFSTVSNSAIHGCISDSGQGYFGNQSVANSVTTDSKDACNSSSAQPPHFTGNSSTVSNSAVHRRRSDSGQSHLSDQSSTASIKDACETSNARPLPCFIGNEYQFCKVDDVTRNIPLPPEPYTSPVTSLSNQVAYGDKESVAAERNCIPTSQPTGSPVDNSQPRKPLNYPWFPANSYGADSLNWRADCKPMGNADTYHRNGTENLTRNTAWGLKRRSDSAAEMQLKVLGESRAVANKFARGPHGRRSDSSFQPYPRQDVNDKNEEKRRWLMDFEERSQRYRFTFIDTHCHIDFLYGRLSEPRSTSFHKFKLKNREFFPANYEGCVAVFCNPRTFAEPNPANDVLKAVEQDDTVWLAIGCHPKMAQDFGQRHLYGLQKALESPKVVALGEIGLDYSMGHDKDIQKNVFRVQLNLAIKLNLPLVIHCRDADDDCLEILQEVVPKDHKIHAHCFTRGWTTALRWLEAFPNLWLGLTPLISLRSAAGAIETATKVPLNRLLLETDAPFFIPGSLKNKGVLYSYPGLALSTAESVAELKKVSVDTVLEACRKNTRDMYGI